MTNQDVIKVYKQVIRQIKRRRRYLYAKEDGMDAYDNCDGLSDAIATLEKYLAKIERKT